MLDCVCLSRSPNATLLTSGRRGHLTTHLNLRCFKGRLGLMTSAIPTMNNQCIGIRLIVWTVINARAVLFLITSNPESEQLSA